MDFGKLDDISKVNFTLPPDPDFNKRVWAALSADRQGSAHLYIGCTGYHMREWLGSWYPAQTKPSGYLVAYGQQFNTIEHNTTYYRIPDVKTANSWYDQTPSDFRFCCKVPQVISHDKQFSQKREEIASFCRALEVLKEKNGCSFLQLPPHFAPEALPELERFLQVWPESMPLAVEVRHPGYFPKGQEMLFELLHRYHAYTVITDVSGRRDVCHAGITGEKVLIRLVGNGMHPTDLSRLHDWSEKINAWNQNGLREIYLFCHQPDNFLAPEFCSQAAQIMAKRTPELITRGPVMIKPQSEQLKLF